MHGRLAVAGSLAAAALLVTACGAEQPDSPGAAPGTTAAQVTTTTTAVEPTPAAPVTTTPAAPPPQPQQQSWVMPNLVGSNLQDAQNAIQELTGYGIFLTTSTDLSGENRNQVIDANWQVCSQNVAPGAAITTGTGIDFGVVKLEERCP